MTETTSDGQARTLVGSDDSLSQGTVWPIWPRRLAIFGGALLVFAVLFWRTFESMVAIWYRSETYAHGFVVLPIALYLVWRRRGQVARIMPRTDWAPLVPLALLGGIWAVANVTDVLIVQQLAVVAMIPCLVWLLLGWPVTRALTFPLIFLVFLVPFGEALIPHLMNFTASFVVHALRLTGIPVYSDGTFFNIPGSRWSVVEGCSGERYLIASLFLGALYAYLTYRAFWRRALFFVLSGIVPVFANGFRAYMIVMIAHLSHMRLALGIDHYIYGWVWFGVVMFALFWIGGLWRERDPADLEDSVVVPVQQGPQEGLRRPIAALVGVLAVMMIGPAWASFMASSGPVTASVQLSTPPGANGWAVIPKPFTTWVPHYVDPTAHVHQQYVHAGNKVGLFLEYYRAQKQGAELINSDNVMVVQKAPVWRQPSQRRITVKLDGRPYEIYESRLESDGQNLLVWHWKWLMGHYLINPYEGKLREVFAKILHQNSDGAGIIVYTQLGDERAEARKVLQGFISDMLPAIEARLKAARNS